MAIPEKKISWFDIWVNIVKPRFLFKTVDLWSYINAQFQLLAYALNPIESAFSQNLIKILESKQNFSNFVCFAGFLSNSVKRRETQLDLERMQAAKARHEQKSPNFLLKFAHGQSIPSSVDVVNIISIYAHCAHDGSSNSNACVKLVCTILIRCKSSLVCIIDDISPWNNLLHS